MTPEPIVLALLVTAASGEGAPAAVTPPVFIPVGEAARLIDTQRATVLDARGNDAPPPYVPGARVVSWDKSSWRARGETAERLTAKLLGGLRSLAGLRTGRLTDDAERVAEDLAVLGVDSDRPVVVYGAMAQGWGEEGRLWWTLAYLGHTRAFILDGGIAAWRAAGLPTAARRSQSAQRGSFMPRLRQELRAAPEQVLAMSREGTAVILDSRRREEYDGATPYLSARGGHIPGALHFFWKNVIADNGRLRSATDIRALLPARAAVPTRPVVVYCTAGVRSGFLVAALTHAGLSAANYDGSWWEWAGANGLPVQRSR
jgi:thiosulfate/3-mercaptopyruvate sulfurtransferase